MSFCTNVMIYTNACHSERSEESPIVNKGTLAEAQRMLNRVPNDEVCDATGDDKNYKSW